MIDENAGELVADSLGEQRRRDGGINAAGKRQQHLTVADLGADRFNGCAHIVAHRPIALCAADLIQEVVQHFLAVFGVVYFRVELHAVKAASFVAYADGRAGCAVRNKAEAFGDLGHVVAVAHPRYALFRQALEQAAVGVEKGGGLAVFASRIRLRGSDLSAEVVRHELAAVAYAEHGNAQLEYLRIHLRRAGSVNALRAAGEDNADGVVCFYFVYRHAVGLYLAVDIAFTDSACDELVILAAEVQNKYALILHSLPSR